MRRRVKTFAIPAKQWRMAEEHPCQTVRRLAEEIGFEVLIERPTLVSGGWQFQVKFSHPKQVEQLAAAIPQAHFL